MCEIGWWLKIAKIGISGFVNSYFQQASKIPNWKAAPC